MDVGWLEDNARSISLAVCLILGTTLAVFGVRLAIAFFLVAGTIVVLSINNPSSEFALQEDNRAKERRRLSDVFGECLEEDGIKDAVEYVCYDADPPSFIVASNKYGLTEDRLRVMCDLSSPAFNSIRYSCEKIEIEKGISGYKIVFHEHGETETLDRISVKYKDIEDEEPSYGRIPVGMFDDGSIAYMSFDNRNALIGGLPRSGKSVLLSTMITGLCRCESERIVILSPKILDFQSFGCRADLYETPEEILDALKGIAAEIEMRKRYCVSRGLKKVEKFHEGMPHITIVIDEYAVIKASQMQGENGKLRKIGIEIEQEIFRIVSQGAFAGCQVCITSQRLSSNVISTDLRDICAGNLLCFASGGKTSDEMIFGDYADEAPAHRIPVSSKGVAFIFQEGTMEHPRLFKAALTDMRTERRIAEGNRNKKPRKNQ